MSIGATPISVVWVLSWLLISINISPRIPTLCHFCLSIHERSPNGIPLPHILSKEHSTSVLLLVLSRVSTNVGFCVNFSIKPSKHMSFATILQLSSSKLGFDTGIHNYRNWREDLILQRILMHSVFLCWCIWSYSILLAAYQYHSHCISFHVALEILLPLCSVLCMRCDF